MVKTKEWVRQEFWWPGLDIKVGRVVRDYTPCSNNVHILKSKKGPMKNRILSEAPWDETQTDVLSPFQGEHVTPCIFVLVDLFSKWPDVKCVQDISF